MFNSTFYNVATTKFKLPYVASIYGSHYVSLGCHCCTHHFPFLSASVLSSLRLLLHRLELCFTRNNFIVLLEYFLNGAKDNKLRVCLIGKKILPLITS